MAALTLQVFMHSQRQPWKFDSFDQDYIDRLASRDVIAEQHFSSYFGDLLLLKLRRRIRSPELIEDIRQETLLRVLRIVRRGGIEHPARFGAFVIGVCNHVTMELLRGETREDELGSEFQPADERVDLDLALVNEQRHRQVATILKELPEKDRELLRMFFLEECDNTEICKRFRIREGYLRVLLHRAKLRFRSMHSSRFNPAMNHAIAPEHYPGMRTA